MVWFLNLPFNNVKKYATITRNVQSFPQKDNKVKWKPCVAAIQFRPTSTFLYHIKNKRLAAMSEVGWQLTPVRSNHTPE